MTGNSQDVILTRNSSLTRVRPFFGQLLDRDETGQTWLGALLRDTVPTGLRMAPGSLQKEIVACRRYSDRVLRADIWLRRCFEYSLEPSRELLTWILEAPQERLTAPAKWTGAEETIRRRKALLTIDHPQHGPTVEAARALLKERGPAGSARQWWAFEGFTEVDCLLRTERLVLLVEGKRTESLSGATSWLPKRNQLARNLEAARAAGEHAYVLLAVEQPLGGLDVDILVADGCPHLDADARHEVARRFLGQRTWAELCELTEVDCRSLPEAIGMTPLD